MTPLSRKQLVVFVYCQCVTTVRFWKFHVARLTYEYVAVMLNIANVA